MIAEIEFMNHKIAEFMQAYYADGFFFLLTIAAFVYLYVSCTELRYKFLLPIFVMIFITVNPILYKYVFYRIIYWRLFWMLPSAILIAAAVIVLLKKLSKNWMKWGVLATMTVFVISQGQYVFSYSVFLPRSNWEKIAQDTIDVCDIIMETDKEAKIIGPVELLTEVRQYAPEISMIYGRNAEGYIRYVEPECKELHNSYCNFDFEYVFSKGAEYRINFIVIPVSIPIEQQLLETYAYKEVGRTAGYIIYYNEEIKHVS